MNELGIHKVTEASVSDQPLEENERALLEEVYATLDVYEQACRPYHQEAKVCRAILRLRDPYQDDENEKHPTLQLNTLKSTFANSVADQMQNMPEARLLPETEAANDVATDLQDATNFIVYTQNNYEAIHRRRSEDFLGTGTAITQVVWDETMNYGKGEIALIRWPIESFLWDPQAENIQDGRANIKVSWHPLSWYTAHYPEAAPYIHGESGQHEDIGKPEAQQDEHGDEDRAMLLEYWYRRYDAKKKKYTINVAYCAGGALLEHQEDVFAHGMYPFVVDVFDTIEGAPVGDGMVSEFVPTMRYINRYAKYIDVNLRMSAKARMLVRRNNGIDKQALADWNTDIIEGDSITPGEDWNWVQNAPFNGMIAQQMLQFQSDLKQDSGTNQYTRGENISNYLSGKAVVALQEAGSKIAQMRTYTLNAGFKEIIEQVLWLMAQFYTEERVMMITGRDGKHREIAVSSARFFGVKTRGAVPVPRYVVDVVINKRNPAQIEARNQMYMQAYTMAAQAQQFFPLSALFKLMNFDGRDRVLPVVEENETYQQQMQQLSQQNQELIAQMEQMAKENQNLKVSNQQMVNSMANVGATQGGGYMQRSPYGGVPRSIPTETREDTIAAEVMNLRGDTPEEE